VPSIALEDGAGDYIVGARRTFRRQVDDSDVRYLADLGLWSWLVGG
jgi:hypothetical protein